MRQPVSRISFDRRRGFLGVHLQEGAPFVDAAWNENADIAWSLLRDAILAAGVEGTAGRELRIDPILADPGSSGRSAADPRAVRGERARLRGLRVCGTSADGSNPPRPFYCHGLPVLWLADLPIDAQLLGDEFRVEATGKLHAPSDGTWIDLLRDAAVREASCDPREVVAAYEIYVRARVETLDRLDDPNLDDPRLDIARGTFRKRVVGEVRVRKADAPRRPADTNVRLSVDGSYSQDLNALYRVELVSLTGARSARAASVLWDPDAAATVARVVGTANQGARQVMVDTLDGFDHGLVRFEGQGIGPELYQITRTGTLPGNGSMLCVTRHRCDRDVQSLAAWQGQLDPSRPGSPEGTLQVSFTVPSAPPAQAGDVLEGLPELLGLDWSKAKVRASDFDPDHSTVALTLEEATSEAGARARSVAGWTAYGPVTRAPDGTVIATLTVPSPIQEGDIVTALPPAVTTDPGPWIVVSKAFTPVTAPQATSAPGASPPPPKLTVTLGPAGLAQPLSTLDLPRRATLRSRAHARDTTLVVDARSDWTVGMQVRILRKQDEHATALDAATQAVQEERTIVRIVHAAEGGWPDGTMLVRLDQPLSHPHAKDSEEVVPARPIRVRRFAGHDCRLAIDRIDPARDVAASLASFPSSRLALPGGLVLHLTIERAETEPRIHPGDGWHFAAHSDGSFETCMFAPVEDEPASEVPLAQLTLHADHYELLDLRPVPASLAIDAELARIGSAGSAITELLGHGELTQVLGEIVRLSGSPRVQRALVQQLADLVDSRHPRLHANPRCRPWLQQLRNALAEVSAWATPDPASGREPTADAEPTRRQVTAIAFALGGLAAALSAEDPSHTPEPKPPAAPDQKPS